MTEQYIRKPNTECAICKKAIYKRPSQIKNNKGRVFCGSTCFGISCRKEIKCVVCGKLILSGLNKKTCSRNCSNKNRAGIHYKLNQPRNKVVAQRQLKIRLLEARGKKCERCEYSKHNILQVHHKNRNRNDNSLKNLELVCPNCHYEEHYSNKEII